MLFLSDVSVQSTLWVNENFFIDAVDAKSDKEPNSFNVHHKNNKEVYLEKFTRDQQYNFYAILDRTAPICFQKNHNIYIKMSSTWLLM